MSAGERELRDFAAARLADFKVPRKIVFLAGDPEGRHRQAAAHRPGRRSWASADEDRASSARARSAACSAPSWRRPARTSPSSRAARISRRCGANGVDAAERRRERHRAAALHRRPGRGRARRIIVIVTLKAHCAARRGAADRAAAGPGDRARHRPSTACPAGISTGSTGPGATGAWRASIPAARCGDMLPPAQAIGCVVYPAAEVRRARRDRAHLRRPLHARRARRQPHAARRGAVEGADRRRTQGAGAAAHPRRDLGEAVGQSRLQPDLRAHRCRRSTASPAIPDCARCAATMMLEAQAVGESARRRASPIDVDKRIDGRGRGRRAQDLDAAGPGARPADGDRRAARRGGGAGRGWSGRPMPTCRNVLALVRERARQAGCY